MSATTATTTSAPSRSITSPSRLDPAKIRVVDVESDSEEIVERFDCYDAGPEEKMFRLDGDQIQIRELNWARSKDMEAEVEIQWTSTGFSFWEVGQIRIFTWPHAEPVRVYKDVASKANVAA